MAIRKELIQMPCNGYPLFKNLRRLTRNVTKSVKNAINTTKSIIPSGS